MFQNDELDGSSMPDVLGGGAPAAPHKGGFSSEGFPPELGFPGDFYRGGDEEVMRGVAMAPGVPSDMYKFGDSDFYCDQDDITRSVSIAPAPWDHSLLSKVLGDSKGFEDQGFGAGYDKDFFKGPSVQEQDPLFHHGSQSSCVPLFQVQRFQQVDKPPVQPSSKHFRFEATTVYFTTDSPFSLGNAVLNYLESKVVASVSKVSRAKLAIKADVFLENIMCSTKIRVWEVLDQSANLGSKEYAVEFQRRSGDPFTFGDVYRQACEFLSLRFPGMRGGPAPDDLGQRLMPPPPPMEKGLDEADIAPLLEMAGMEALPTMQAEAASTLASIACEDLRAAKLLCKSETFDKIAKLLEQDQLDIAYPTARLLTSLLVQKEAEQQITEHGILKQMIGKAAGSSVDRIVSVELSKAVSTAVRHFGKNFPADTTKDLRKSLDQAMRSEEVKKARVVYESLQDAMLELDQC